MHVGRANGIAPLMLSEDLRVIMSAKGIESLLRTYIILIALSNCNLTVYTFDISNLDYLI